MPFRLVMDKAPSIKLRANLAGLGDRMVKAMAAAMNMARALIESAAKADIARSGNFGQRWTGGLHVNFDPTLGNMRLSMTHDISYAGIFETGGVIKGNPLLWLPFSGTDAVGVQAKDYGGLFSIRRRSGIPLLFAISDKKPRYFGVESVTIPKKWHLNDVQKSVMSNFRALFDQAFRNA